MASRTEVSRGCLIARTQLTWIEEQDRKIQDIVSSDQDYSIKIDQIAKVRRWFQPEDGSAFYSTIQDHMAEKLTLEEASDILFAPIDKKINAEKLDDVNFIDFWYSVIHSARRITFRKVGQHMMLIDLVESFKKHSIPSNEKYNYLYDSLIDFDMACREAYNDHPEPGSATDIEYTTWANMNFFFALLTGKGLHDLTEYFAIWAMRQALEYQHADDEKSTAVQKYDVYVPAAAVWVFGAFRGLLVKNKDLTPENDLAGNPARGGDLWKGKSEFSKERWSFWRERFAEIGKMDEVSEDTRTVARDAVNAMERAATFEKV